MKRPKLKKASKRLSCAKRYKIQKKVRQHNKKVKREAKKKGVSKRPKKDLGVPSSAPFKEEVLREAEQRRLQIEEEKEKRKQAKKEERAKKRKQEKESGDKDPEPKAKKLRKDEAVRKQKAVERNSQHYIVLELNKVIDVSDVVVEVLDARDPLGCRCPQVEEAVVQKNKKLIFILNKIDLIPKENAEKWISCLQKEFPVVAFKASTNIQDKTMQGKRRRVVPSNGVLDKSRGASCFGNNLLTEILTNYALTQPEGALKVGLVGFPNVGKSSVINSVKGILACNAGVKRGITKSMQEVHLSKNVKLLDSPGVVAVDSSPASSLVLRSLRVEEGQDSVMEAVRTLLKQCDKTQVMLQYNIPDYRNSLEFLTLLAKKRGFLQKGGVPDSEHAATVFLSDWTGAKLSYHCKPPENPALPPFMSDAVVTEMKKGWDLAKIKSGNDETLKEVKFPNPSSSISFTSNGSTSGVLNANDICEKPPPPEATEKPVVIQLEQTANEDKVEEEVKEETKMPQKVQKKKSKAAVKFAPVDISSSTDDAYDFNTDFV